jgi:DNA-binding GntR family transcriptional regulator
VLVNPADPRPTELKDVNAAARSMGLQIDVHNADTSAEIDAAFAAMGRERPDAVFVGATPFLNGGDLSSPEIWKRYDWEFHHALLPACGSKALLEVHSAVYDKYLRYQMIAVVFRGEVAAREHRQLMECALKRDAKTAQAVLVKHIQDCVVYTLSNSKIGPKPTVSDRMTKPRKPLLSALV